MSELPSAHAPLRAELEREAQRVGWPALHARLAERDPQTAARLAPNDAQRIQRALEILEVAGVPMSQLLVRRATSSLQFAVVAIVPADRAVLHRQIEHRFDSMLERGFLDEVRALKSRGDLTPDLPSMRSVGYRQAWIFLDGSGTRDQFRAAAIAATRQLAKRQLTWLRSLTVDETIDPRRSRAACARSASDSSRCELRDDPASSARCGRSSCMCCLRYSTALRRFSAPRPARSHGSHSNTAGTTRMMRP